MSRLTSRLHRQDTIALLVGVPVVVWLVRALGDGWYPYGDRAVIAVRSFEVFGSASPLVGQYSTLSEVAQRSLFSLGPLLYWLLAVPVRLGTAWMPVVMAVVNLVCVVGVVVLARRRGGVVLGFGVAFGMVLMLRSLPVVATHDVWNPYVALLPFWLLLWLAWAAGGGETWALPWVVGVASFLVQAHLTYALPALAAVAAAVAGWWPRRVTARRRGWWALGVFGVCWLFPLLDIVLHPPGNVLHVVRGALRGHTSLGLQSGWYGLAHAIGVAPWWTRAPVGGFAKLAEVLEAPSALTQVTAAVFLLGLLVMLVAGVRRRQASLLVPAGLALAGCVALGLDIASTPTVDLLGLTIGYTIWWASPLGLFVWAVIAWAVASRVRYRPPPFPAVTRFAPAVAAIALAVLAVAVAVGRPHDDASGEYRPFDRFTDQLRAILPPGRSILVSADLTTNGFELQASAVYTLLRHGDRVFVPDAVATELGPSFALGGHRVDDEVAIGFGHRPAGGRLIATVTARVPSPVIGTWSVVLRTGPPGRTSIAGVGGEE